MAAQGIAEGRYTLGDFVLVNTYLLQLYSPLSFFGFIYREIKQAIIDMERMFELLTRIARSPTGPARAIWPCPAPRSNSATCVSATTSAGRS